MHFVILCLLVLSSFGPHASLADGFFSAEVAMKSSSNGKPDGGLEVWKIHCIVDGCEIQSVRFSGGFIFFYSNTLELKKQGLGIRSMNIKERTVTFVGRHWGGWEMNCLLKARAPGENGVRDFTCTGINPGITGEYPEKMEFTAIDGEVDLKAVLSSTKVYGKMKQ